MTSLPGALGALGGAWVADSDGQPSSPTSPKQAAILALLLLDPGRTVRFETFTSCLWPDRNHHDVTQTLRVHVSNLRRWLRVHADRALVDAIVTRSTGYEFTVDPGQVDVALFTALVTEAQLALASGDAAAATELLETALRAWGEPFIELSDHAPAEPEINRLAVLHELAVDELVNARLAAGHGAQVVGELEARVKSQPWREQVHRQLMVALYQSGRQAESLEVYSRARMALIEELGVEPGPQLRETQAAILDQTLDVGTPAPRRSADLVSPSPEVVPSELFGRDAEVHIALDALGSNSTIVVFGEAGLGKTELLGHLQRVAPERSWISCLAFPDREAPPLWPILSALDLTAPEHVDDDAAAFTRNRSIIDMIASRQAPVLVIDDFQWADEATIGIVRQLTAMQPENLSLILALRDTPLELESPGGRAAMSISRQPATTVVQIRPLELDAVRSVVEATAPQRADEVEQLHERSSGNPLFLSELLRSNALAAGGISEVPPAIASLVSDRLSAIDPASANILSVASVVGNRIELALLLRVHSCSVDELMHALDAGRRIGIIASKSGVDEFVHALIRDALNNNLDDAARRRIHDRVARGLERDNGEVGRLTRCAAHAMAALPIGSAERAVSASMAAGREAAANFAFRDATKFLEDAHAALEFLDDHARDKALPEVLCELGRNMIRAGSSKAGAEVVMRGGNLARERNDVALFAMAARSIGEGRSAQSMHSGRKTEFVEAALAATSDLVSADRVKLLIDVAGMRYFTHSVEHRRELADRAIELSEHFDDRSRAEALIGKITALNVPSTSLERVALAEVASAAARRCGSLELMTLAASAEIVTHLEQGNRNMAEQVLGRTRSTASTAQAPRLTWSVQGFDVVAAILAGDFDRADELALESLMTLESGSHPDAVIAYGSQIVATGLLREDPTVPRQVMEATLALDPDNHTYRTVRAYVLALEGDPEASVALDEVARRLAADPRDETLTLPILAMIGEVAQITGVLDADLACTLASIAEPVAHLHVFMNAFGTCGFPWGSLHHGHGLLLIAAGDLNGARAALRRAVEANEQIRSETFSNRSRQVLASLDD